MLTSGMNPGTSVIDAIWQVALMGLLRYVSLFYLMDFGKITQTCHAQKVRSKEDTCKNDWFNGTIGTKAPKYCSIHFSTYGPGSSTSLSLRRGTSNCMQFRHNQSLMRTLCVWRWKQQWLCRNRREFLFAFVCDLVSEVTSFHTPKSTPNPKSRRTHHSFSNTDNINQYNNDAKGYHGPWFIFNYRRRTSGFEIVKPRTARIRHQYHVSTLQQHW